MNNCIEKISALALIAFGLIFTSCSGSEKTTGETEKPQGDTTEIVKDTVPSIPQPGDSTYHFQGSADIIRYLDNSKNAAKYKGGILYTIAREVPEYADKLIPQLNKYDYFIVVDKASMQVVLFDKYGQVEKSYGMACARNYGTKLKKADSRTPEGFFSVEGIYDSTNWHFTNDWGYTSPAKGVFGPRFIRLKIPTTTQIGIHGTSSRGSIGHRVSHGCIRVQNENILELVKYAKPGMPVMVLPGKQDRAANKANGQNIAYFPLDSKYAITESEASELSKKTTKEPSKEAVASKSTTKKTEISSKEKPSESSVEAENKENIHNEIQPASKPAQPDSIR